MDLIRFCFFYLLWSGVLKIPFVLKLGKIVWNNPASYYVTNRVVKILYKKIKGGIQKKTDAASQAAYNHTTEYLLKRYNQWKKSHRIIKEEEKKKTIISQLFDDLVKVFSLNCEFGPENDPKTLIEIHKKLDGKNPTYRIPVNYVDYITRGNASEFMLAKWLYIIYYQYPKKTQDIDNLISNDSIVKQLLNSIKQFNEWKRDDYPTIRFEKIYKKTNC